MKKLIDKLAIFIVSLALYTPNSNAIYRIVPILIAIILSAFLSYLEDEPITIAVFTAYIILCLFKPVFLCFIPLICYDVVFLKIKWVWLLSFLPLIIGSTQALFISHWLIAAFIIAAYILKHRTVSLQNIEKDYYKLRDNAKEISMRLEKQNKEPLQKQNHEIIILKG